MAMTADGCIQFTRHAGDVLLNFNRLRSRNLLTDVTVLVDGQIFHAHKAILVACSGFFYSVFMKAENESLSAISLDPKVDPKGFSLLLDFMYTSFLNVDATVAVTTLNTAIYLQMEHVADTCHRFIKSRHQTLNMQMEEIQMNPSNLAEDISAKKCAEEKEPDFRKALLLRLSPQECGGYIPNVFRGINTSGSYHVYGDLHVPAAVLESSNKILGRQELHTSMAQSSMIQPAAAHRNLQCPTSPMEGHNTQHPQTGCLRATQSYGKGVICSPQSPLRFDCQPNSPTESSSSINARMSLKQACDIPTDAKARNWKKYKFIVLNQTPNGSGTEAHGRGPEADAASPTREMASGHEDLQPEKGADSRREETPLPPSELSCSSRFHSSPQTEDTSHISPGAYSSDEATKTCSDYSPSSCENNFFCNGCDSKFSEEESLKDHMGQVHSDKPYKCNCCQAAFRYKGNLASHKTVHTGAKPYHCNICGAQFNRPANLKTHTRIHSGEKPYKCETCGSRFVQVAHLRAHVLIHTGEKPYPCDICGTHFRHLQTLKSHMRIHTGEKPYHCEKCDLHFRHKSQLRLHLRQKHGAVTNTKAQYSRSAGNMVAGAPTSS